jgi:hypothetical protein
MNHRFAARRGREAERLVPPSPGLPGRFSPAFALPRRLLSAFTLSRRLLPALVLFCVIALTACGGAGERAGETLDIRGLAEALIGGIAFADRPEEASADAFYAMYAIDPADESVTDFVFRTSTGATAEEVTIIEARDAESATALMKIARARIASQKAEFEDYAPDEMTKLNDPVLLRKGKYIILCLSNDNAAAETIIEGFIE